jgi:hypothetical protein
MDSKINEKWNKFRKKLSSKKEEATEPKSKLGSNENESKEQYSGVESVENIQTTDYQQLAQQPSSSSGAAATTTTNQVPSGSKSAMTTSYHDNDNENNYYNDYILNVLNDLPEQWIGKEMKLHVIADRRDASWVTRRIFEDVERGLINAQFTVKESNHLCDITFVLKIADGLASFPSAVTAINPVFTFILTDIKSKVIFRRKRRIKLD